MHITHVTEHDVFDPDSQSGTPYWMSKSLEQAELDLYRFHISHTLRLLPPLEEFAYRCRQFYLRLFKKGYLVPSLHTRRARYIAEVLKGPLARLKTDVILTSATPIAGAYLETRVPLVYWTDAVYAALANFYPHFRGYHPEVMWDGHEVTQACLTNAKMLIFSSDWAARTAVEFYGVAKHKIHVVQYGANLDIDHNLDEVKAIIKARRTDCIKLLFVGKQWFRKGGDLTLEIAQALHEGGYPVELTLVCESLPKDVVLPPYVHHIKLISKRTPAGIKQLCDLYKQSHLLLLPTRAEAYGVVFCEANAFGVPCVTTCVGGIPSVIQDNVNGMMFSLEATIKEVCDYIANLFHDRPRYEALALSAFNEYQTRLNWQVASARVKKLITEI